MGVPLLFLCCLTHGIVFQGELITSKREFHILDAPLYFGTPCEITVTPISVRPHLRNIRQENNNSPRNDITHQSHHKRVFTAVIDDGIVTIQSHTQVTAGPIHIAPDRRAAAAEAVRKPMSRVGSG